MTILVVKHQILDLVAHSLNMDNMTLTLPNVQGLEVGW